MISESTMENFWNILAQFHTIKRDIYILALIHNSDFFHKFFISFIIFDGFSDYLGLNLGLVNPDP